MEKPKEKTVGAVIGRPQTEMMLLPYGEIVNDAIAGIAKPYSYDIGVVAI